MNRHDGLSLRPQLTRHAIMWKVSVLTTTCGSRLESKEMRPCPSRWQSIDPEKGGRAEASRTPIMIALHLSYGPPASCRSNLSTMERLNPIGIEVLLFFFFFFFQNGEACVNVMKWSGLYFSSP